MNIRSLCAVFILVIVSGCALYPHSANEEIHSLKLAVFDFEAQGVSQAEAQKVTEVLYTAISALIENKRLNYF